jgi:hypothetical protein
MDGRKNLKPPFGFAQGRLRTQRNAAEGAEKNPTQAELERGTHSFFNSKGVWTGIFQFFNCELRTGN